MNKPIDIKAAEERLKRKRYAVQVLTAYDKIEHVDKRGKLEKRAEIERKARNQF